MTAEIVEVDFLDPRVLDLRAQMGAEMGELYGTPRHSVGAEDVTPE